MSTPKKRKKPQVHRDEAMIKCSTKCCKWKSQTTLKSPCIHMILKRKVNMMTKNLRRKRKNRSYKKRVRRRLMMINRLLRIIMIRIRNLAMKIVVCCPLKKSCLIIYRSMNRRNRVTKMNKVNTNPKMKQKRLKPYPSPRKKLPNSNNPNSHK